MNTISYKLPDNLQAAVEKSLADWQQNNKTGRLWKKDASLNGVFLQITCGHEVDLQVPGHEYSFGMVEAAQEKGDFEVLAERGRRVLRVHVGPDIEAGLEQLVMLLSPQEDPVNWFPLSNGQITVVGPNSFGQLPGRMNSTPTVLTVENG